VLALELAKERASQMVLALELAKERASQMVLVLASQGQQETLLR
jgi:hypothetical protein